MNYGIRKHSTGFTINQGNLDSRDNWKDDGQLKDIITFSSRQEKLAYEFYEALIYGEIKLA